MNDILRKKIQSQDYELSTLLNDASLDQLAATMQFCFLNTSAVELILLRNFQQFSRLEHRHWKEIITNALVQDEYHIESLLTFLQVYCRIDQVYLLSLGIPEDRIYELMNVVGSPDFPYDLYSDNDASLSRFGNMCRKQKQEGLEKAGLSTSEHRELYNFFTDPANKSRHENPIVSKNSDDRGGR